MKTKRTRQQKNMKPTHEEPFGRRLPDGFGEVALALFLLPPLFERLWLLPGQQLIERFMVYSLWLLPAMVLCYYLGMRGAMVSGLAAVPFLIWNITRHVMDPSEFHVLLAAYYALFMVFIWFAGILAEKFKRQEEKLKRESLTDELTGVFNHRFFYRCLEKETDRSRRYKQPLSLVIVDLDNFKKYNDTWGHLQGDRALVAVAKIMKDTVRNADTLARYGGEEFAIILPQTDLVQAKRVCERIREAMASTTIASPDGDTGPLTASFGVSSYEKNMTGKQLVDEADRVLYFAKSSGKNLVTAIKPETR
ncbi:MAG: GGDEF domain-containing protein [Bacillota bacterium]|nr:GGDEF domain-containing protein [Bacillota bacterium]MDW7684160.1 GGDEF domain-containing protein [Bacillota bacterium]